MPQFERCLGIDYSGTATPASSLKGLRIYQANQAKPTGAARRDSAPCQPTQVLDPTRPRHMAGSRTPRRPGHPCRH